MCYNVALSLSVIQILDDLGISEILLRSDNQSYVLATKAMLAEHLPAVVAG
jgi:hypothetical protein